MIEFLIKLLLVARSKLKSRARFDAEDIVLRQQVILLSRKARSRLQLGMRAPVRKSLSEAAG
jgi:hypothetical protein